MQLVMHYLKMVSTLASRSDDDGYVKVALPELAGMLYCTERNAKLLVKKMTDAGWIDWVSGSGRGNSSRVKFMAAADELMLEEAKAIVAKGRLAEALELMRVDELGQAERQRFMAWVAGYFGHSVESEEGLRELDVLRMPVYKTVHTLDPAAMFYAFDAFMILQLYDTLLRFDNGEISAGLAFAWEESVDGLAWSLRLRKGVRFHNGEELTAEHVRRSVERVRDSGSMHRWLLEDVVAIDAVGRYKVVFRFAARNTLFLQAMCSVPFAIITETSDRHALVGTGPFQLVRQTESEIVLEANETYYRGRPHMDRIEMWMLPESVEPVVTAALADSPLVFDHRMPIELTSEQEDGRQVRSMESGISLMTFNMTRPGPLMDKKLRLAIDVCLDRERMAAELGGYRLGAATGLIVTEHRGAEERNRAAAESKAEMSGLGRWVDLTDLADSTGESLRSILGAEERVLLARHYLSQSGYAGETLRLYVYPLYGEDAEWVRARLAEIGVKVDIVIRTLQDMSEIAVVREADMIIYGTVADEPEELAYLGFFEMELSFVRTHMSEEMATEVSRAARSIRGEPDATRRLAMYRQLERRLIDERTVLPMMRKSLSMAHDKNVKGAAFNSLGWADLPNIWFD